MPEVTTQDLRTLADALELAQARADALREQRNAAIKAAMEAGEPGPTVAAKAKVTPPIVYRIYGKSIYNRRR